MSLTMQFAAVRREMGHRLVDKIRCARGMADPISSTDGNIRATDTPQRRRLVSYAATNAIGSLRISSRATRAAPWMALS